MGATTGIFLVGVAAFGAFVGRLGRLGTFVGRLGRSVETLHATSLQPRPLRPPNPSNRPTHQTAQPIKPPNPSNRPPNPATTTINRKQNNIITIPNG